MSSEAIGIRCSMRNSDLATIRGFHEAFGGIIVQKDRTTLTTERIVAGEEQVTAFVLADSNSHSSIVQATERAHPVKTTRPGASIRIIAPELPSQETMALVSAASITSAQDQSAKVEISEEHVEPSHCSDKARDRPVVFDGSGL